MPSRVGSTRATGVQLRQAYYAGQVQGEATSRRTTYEGGKKATCKSSLRAPNPALKPSFSRKANVTDAWGKAWNTCGGARLRRGFVRSACKRARPQHLQGIRTLEQGKGHDPNDRDTVPQRRPLPWPLAWRRASASRSSACFCRTATRWLSRQQSLQYTARQRSQNQCFWSLPLPDQNHPQTLRSKPWTRSGCSGTPHMFSQVITARGTPSAKPACIPGTASGDWSGVRL